MLLTGVQKGAVPCCAVAESHLVVLAVIVAFLRSMLNDDYPYQRLAIATKLLLEAKRGVRRRQQHTAGQRYRRTEAAWAEVNCSTGWLRQRILRCNCMRPARGACHGECRSRLLFLARRCRFSIVALACAGNQSSKQRSVRLLRCR